MSEHLSGDEPYILVEEVAERLGLPLAVLLRRVEAGDVPSRRVERDGSYHYALRLSDLGIETDDMPEPVPGTSDAAEEPDGIGVFDLDQSDHVETAIASAFNTTADPAGAADTHRVPADDSAADRTAAADEAGGSNGADEAEAADQAVDPGWRVASPRTPAADNHPAADPAAPDEATDPGWAEVSPDAAKRWHGVEEVAQSKRSWQADEETLPAWAVRPLEPRQPPPGFAGAQAEVEPAGGEPSETEASDAELSEVDASHAQPSEMEPSAAEPATEQPPTEQPPTEQPAAAWAYRDDSQAAPAAQATSMPEDAAPSPKPAGSPTFAGPERRRDPTRGLLDLAIGGRSGDLSAMSLDARDLVAGLLDRWERTLEQRIYTEQRQRFQAELSARQAMVKQLQMELQAVRAEHAAAQAEKDRMLAEKERELADRERDLAEVRRYAVDTDRLIAPAAPVRRRRWFRGREEAD